MKKLLTKSAICITILGSFIIAKPITEKDAENIAIKWMESKKHLKFKIKKQYQSVLLSKNNTKFYKNIKIIELKPKGWVIVSLDDASRQILAYGFSKLSKNPPSSFLTWLKRANKYVDFCKIKYKNRKIHYSSKKGHEYKSNNDSDYIVRPLLWMGASGSDEQQGIRWNQGQYYNALTPVDENGDHTLTGCVATAMGQLMRYYKYPSQGKGQHCYTPETHPEYGKQCANFGETVYNWDSMPYKLTSDNSEVAKILYHAGVSVDMDYDPDGSAATGWSEALKKYFGYKLAAELQRSDFNETEWTAILHNELDHGRPIYSSGGQENGPGHVYIIDGYDSNGYYHFNWGWNGYYNGKYLLDDENNFPLDQTASIIAPSDSSLDAGLRDEKFAQCIRSELGLSEDDNIGELSVRYLDTVKCDDKNIERMEPLDKFKGVKYFWAEKNRLKGSIDLSGMRLLEIVSLGDNNLTSVKLPKNSNIFTFSADHNNIQGKIDLSGMAKLEDVFVYDNNITSIDLTGDTSLSMVSVSDNNLSSLSLPKNPGLIYVSAYMNNFQGEMNLSGMTGLEYSDLNSNKLNSLILPDGAHIKYLNISSNPINILKIKNLKNIKDLYADDTAYRLQCWQKESLKMENNITNIYADCDSLPYDKQDIDGDGINNLHDIDDDNDGIYDLEDNDIDGDGVANNLDTDINNNNSNNGNTNNSNSNTHSHTEDASGSGGGAMGYGFILLFILIILFKKENVQKG